VTLAFVLASASVVAGDAMRTAGASPAESALAGTARASRSLAVSGDARLWGMSP